jgi:hypothetical protein
LLDNLKPNPGDGPLVKRARALAKAEFAKTSSGGALKVCAVALDLTSGDSVALFSGKFGFNQLLELPDIGKRDDVTSNIKKFLKSPGGGEFTEDQINKSAYAQQGAMNCAEPKVWFYLATYRNLSPRNWIMIPFAMQGGELVYSPPCENCRRWVYGNFHYLSRLTAASYGGPGALAPGKLRKK